MNNLEIAIYELERLASDAGIQGLSYTADHLQGIAHLLTTVKKDMERLSDEKV